MTIVGFRAFSQWHQRDFDQRLRAEFGRLLTTFLMDGGRLALFEVALFRTAGDQRSENTGNYHNPTRQ